MKREGGSFGSTTRLMEGFRSFSGDVDELSPSFLSFYSFFFFAPTDG
jgi:hypothetical protein